MSIWYRAGTPTVSDGSTTVTFVGADLIANNVNAGDVFHGPDGDAYEIASITSATTLELTQPYRLKSGYAIQPTRGIVKDLRDAVQAQVSQVSGLITGPLAGRFPVGTAAAPGMSFGEDTDTGFYRASANAIGIALGGVSKGSISASGVNLSVPVTATGFTGPLSGNTTGTHTGDVDGNASTATALADPFTLSVGGGASGSVEIDGSGDVSLDLALESLPALSASITDASAVVASGIYSLADMSDGGAAIRNAKHTSWHKAWGPFPEKFGVYATASSVTIRDLTKAGAPVWATISGGAYIGALVEASTYPITSIRWTDDGVLWVGQGGTYGGLAAFDFAKGRPRRYRALGSTNRSQGYSSRGIEEFAVVGQYDDTPLRIASENVNSVASFTYPDAPCDPETGLPIATIAVGHSAGVSVIKADGAVANKAQSGGVKTVAFDDLGNLFAGYSELHFHFIRAAGVRAGDLTSEYVAAYLSGAPVKLPVSAGTEIVCGVGGKVFARGIWGRNGVVAYTDGGGGGMYAATCVTDEWADTQLSGLVGSWLNSNDDADLVGGELVTNGDFTSSISGAVNSSLGSGSIEWDASGAMLLTSEGSANVGIADFQVTGLTVGKEYVATYVVGSTTGSLNGVKVGTTQNGTQYHNVGSVGAGVVIRTFTATSTTAWLRFTGFYGTGTTLLDSVSLRRADPDRSVSDKGLAVYGTVAKSEAVAGSGGLMAYSGFSASNYLQQPYNSAMDFGTGDFTIAALVYGADSLSTATIMSRATSNITGWHLYKETTASTGALKLRMAGAVLSGTSKIGAGWYHVAARRIGSTVDLIVNGRVEATYTVSTTMSSTAPLQVGWSTVTPLVAGLPAITQAQAYNVGLSDDAMALLSRMSHAAINGRMTLRSGDIKSIAADPYTGNLYVLTAWGLQVFDGKTLQEIGATAMTGKTRVAVHNGAVSAS